QHGWNRQAVGAEYHHGEDEPLDGQWQGSPYHRRTREQKVTIACTQAAEENACGDGGEVPRLLKEKQQPHQQQNQAEREFQPPAQVFIRGETLRQRSIESQLQRDFLIPAQYHNGNRMVEHRAAERASELNYVVYNSAIYTDDSVPLLHTRCVAGAARRHA